MKTFFVVMIVFVPIFSQEYVSTGYLNMELGEHQNHPNAKHSSRENDYEDEGDVPRDMADITTAKYSWGPRAHKEYSKYAMLKFVVAVSFFLFVII